MKKTVTEKNLCPLVLGLGGIGAALRFWLFATGVDDKGLLAEHHPAGILIYILTALTVAVLAYAVTRCPKALRKPMPASPVGAVGCFVAAAGILLANILELTGFQDTVTGISTVLGILAAVSFLHMGMRRKNGHRSSVVAFAVVIVYYMVHLIMQYRMWSSETQAQSYFFPLLASVFLMLFAYHRAALDVYGKSFRAYVFFNQAALFFCCLSLNTEERLFYITMAIWLATDLYIPRAKRKPTGGGSEEKEEEKMDLPEAVRYCIDALTAAGFSAYAVGGCVRDSLLGKLPHDYDMCTSATPEQICQVFAHCQLVHNGEKHGTVGVVLDGQVYEITTFRTEGGYSDSRHPDWVDFVTDVKEDLARRDFTVNAMAYHPQEGYVDHWGGREDLQAGILRTVGDPNARFTEDPLRILRGVRFAVRYNLVPEKETETAMFDLAPLMDRLARERVFDELCKLLPLVTARDLIRFAPILVQVIPELEPAVSFHQCNPNHRYDVYTHTAHVVATVSPALPLRWAALLHDAAKPQCFLRDEQGVGHFPDHAPKSAEIAHAVLKRLKAPTALRQQVCFLVEAHMLELPADKKVLCRRVSKFGMEAIRNLLQLQRADQLGTGKCKEADPRFGQVEQLLDEIEAENTCLQIKDLAIGGTELQAAGIAPGPIMGKILEQLLEMVISEQIPNEPSALLAAAREMDSE